MTGVVLPVSVRVHQMELLQRNVLQVRGLVTRQGTTQIRSRML